MSSETGEGLERSRPEPITASAAFGALAQVRNMEAQLRWIGFQGVITLNIAGGAGLLIFLRTNGFFEDLAFGVIAVALAMFFNFIHYKILGRDGKFMELWNKKLIELEQTNGIEGGVQIFASVRHFGLRGRLPTVQEVLRMCVILCACLWAAGGLWIILRMTNFGG